MTAVAAPAPTTGLRAEIEPRPVVMWGLISGVTAVFIAAIGMLQVFDARKVIDPILSLGYVAIIWIPIYFGYKASFKPTLEGMEPPRLGSHNLVAGAMVGALGGAVVGAFALLADSVNLRDILVNVTPRVVELLTLGSGTGTGFLVLVGVGAGLGAIGGLFHLMRPLLRQSIVTAAIWVLAINFLELVIGNILREAGAGAVDRLIYSRSRGLTVVSAGVVAAVAAGLRVTLRGRMREAVVRFRTIPEATRKRSMFWIAVGLLALGWLLPSVFGLFLNELLVNVGLFMLLAFGLNVVIGYAGLLDLGYVAFFAVGAYTAAVLTSPFAPGFSPEMAFFEAMPFVLFMAAIAGLIIGTPVIRMRGDYLAIVTLAFGEIARLIVQADWLRGTFGGAQGIIRIAPGGIRVLFGYALVAAGAIAIIIGLLRWREARRNRRDGSPYSTGLSSSMVAIGVAAIGLGIAFPTFATWTVRGIDPQALFRIVLVFAAFAAFVSWRLQESRVGRAWMAIREDEQIAQTMGINIVTTKLLAFVMGAMLASLGGALFAVKIGTVFPASFQIVQSIIILVIVIVGGIGSLRGVAVGALVLIGILGGPTQPGLLREFQEFKLLIYGVILVWMMLQRPEGLLPSARRSRELHQEEMLQDAWIKQTAAPSTEDGA